MSQLATRVQKLIDTLVAEGVETGVQVAVRHHGEVLVDVVAGEAAPGRPMERDTLVPSHSTGKGVTATVVHVLAERGALGYDTPIAAHWPEFAANGKAGTTLRHALAHQAGVPHLPHDLTPETLVDWDAMCAILEAAEPMWEPGTAHGYHGWTFGWLLGETVRRATGRTIGEVLAEEVAAPLGVPGELYIGVPKEELGRVAYLSDGNWNALVERMMAAGFDVIVPDRARPTAELTNRPEVVGAELAAQGTVTARALAKMYAALLGEVDGVRLVSPERLAEIGAEATTGDDRIFGRPQQKALGWFTGFPQGAERPGTFGMNGSGGSVGFADPVNGLAVAITKNHMNVGPHTAAAVVTAAVYEELGL
ncbi:esterase [Actinorhabdospora filicis]|uniref:Esterase n=1 Tax=Actinorhabdospora filicis TaxID=1785913 RepID=A0A9W6W8E5_9ACTN|nr:serine hydrolase domain-containing protein [Actinorhabdospora filicis]GLZ75590.1 esterase [Actinorhabdospora filicis]